MKLNPKKYPLLISTIVSCVLVVISLFILGFFGFRLGVSIGGGSRFEVKMETTVNKKEYVSSIKSVLKKHGLSVDTAFVEDKYGAGAGEVEYTRKCLVVQIAKNDISEEERAQIKADIIEKLGVDASYVSDVEEIVASTQAKSVLYIALAVGIVAVCFFVFGWVRYDIFAGISFIVAFLHNIILYLSLLILTRVPLTVMSLTAALVLTLVMSVVLVSIYEKFKENSSMQSNEKTPVSELMMESEKSVVKPYLIIIAVALVVSLALLFIPSNAVKFSALGMILALLVTVYTSIIIGPGAYGALLEIRDMNRKAILSRNDQINKAIKKKIKKNSK